MEKKAKVGVNMTTDSDESGIPTGSPTEEEIEKLKKLRKDVIDTGFDEPFPELAPPPPANPTPKPSLRNLP